MAEPILNINEVQRQRLEKAEEHEKKAREKRNKKNKPAFDQKKEQTKEPQENRKESHPEKHHVEDPKLGALSGEPRKGVPISKEEAKKITKIPEVYIITKTVVKESQTEKYKKEDTPESSLTEQSRETGSRGTGLLDATRSLVRLDTGEEVKITKPIFSIGKSDKFADFVITGSKVISRRHAEIINRGGVYYLRDKNSTNGTFIDGMPLQPETEVEIKEGQVITLANIQLRFQ